MAGNESVAPLHISDFPADTRWVQLKGGAIGVTPDARVFKVTPGCVVELVEKKQ